jgi:hypothetical protein
MNEVPKVIKDFSKSESPQGREEVGKQIWEKRSEHFAAKRELAERIEQVVADAQEKERQAAETVGEIQGIEAELVRKKSNIFTELFNFFVIKELEKSLSDKQSDHDQALQEHGDIQAILRDLELQKIDTSKLDEAKKTLADFYDEQEEAWEEYEKEKEIRDVPNIMRDNDVVFIHSIKPDFVPGDNSLLREGATWRSKLDITLSMDPVLSTSTIKEGDTRTNMWGTMGVLLKGGLVQRAFASDGATMAKGTKSRAFHDESTMPIDQEIDEALEGSEHYNEFVVDNGEVAGYYVCIDQETGVRHNDMVAVDDVVDEIKERNMPLYVIEAGIVYEAVYVPENFDRSEAPPKRIPAHLTKGKKVEIVELLDNDFNISEEEKLAKKEVLFKDSPFRIKTPEVDWIDSHSQGSRFYMASEIVDLASFPEAEEDFTAIAELVQKYREGANKEIKVINHIVDVTENIYTVLIDEKKYFVRQNKLTKALIFIPLEGDNFYRDTDRIWTGVANENLGRNLKTNEDYIEGASSLIDELQSRADKFSHNRLQKIAFHLFGFIDAAKLAGDHDMVAKATAIAEKIVPLEKYQETMSRRFDEKRNFVITEEDLN